MSRTQINHIKRLICRYQIRMCTEFSILLSTVLKCRTADSLSLVKHSVTATAAAAAIAIAISTTTVAAGIIQCIANRLIEVGFQIVPELSK